MKKKQNFTQEESTLLQEIARTYRYPDGSLNGIAVFISTLALVLLLILGHFMVEGIQNLRGMNSVSAKELTMAQIEEYITDAYLDAVEDYSKGKLDHEAAKRQIIKHISEYLSSSDAFTEEQKTALDEYISQYLESINLEKNLEDNTINITNLTNKMDEYITENDSNLTNIKNQIQTEISNLTAQDEQLKQEMKNDKNQLQGNINNLESKQASDKEYIEKQLALLKELNKKLEDLELDHYNQLDSVISEYHSQLKALEVKNSANLDSLNNSLTDIIKQNASLTEEQQKQMLELINNNADSSAAGLSTLHQQLLDIINGSDSTNAKEREKLLEQLASLEGNTASQLNSYEVLLDNYGKRIQRLEDRTTSLDKSQEFQFDYRNGSYGYSVDGTFRPY